MDIYSSNATCDVRSRCSILFCTVHNTKCTMSENNIISLLELQKSREKSAELIFYKEKLDSLRMRQSFIHAEIELTVKIIELIEKEKIIEVVRDEQEP